MIFCIVVDPLTFTIAVLLASTTLFSILGFVSHPPILALTASRVEVTLCSMVLTLLTPYYIYLIISLSHLKDSDTSQLDLLYENTWDTCWTTYLKWGGYCASSGPWTSPVLLWNICLPPNHSSWYSCSTRRVDMMRWSRGWIYASQYMNRFPQKRISISSSLQYVGCLWGNHAWNDTSSWFTDFSWCMRILRVCQGVPFLQCQIKVWLHHIVLGVLVLEGP